MEDFETWYDEYVSERIKLLTNKNVARDIWFASIAAAQLAHKSNTFNNTMLSAFYRWYACYKYNDKIAIPFDFNAALDIWRKGWGSTAKTF